VRLLAAFVLPVAAAAAAVALASGGTTASSAVSSEAFNRWESSCDFIRDAAGKPKYRKQVDPIVAPGKTSAHMHDFYGRKDVSSFMFAQAMWPLNSRNDPGYQPLPTSCLTYGDWAGYWYPTPKWNGTDTSSGSLLLTWQAPAGEIVQAPPFGMAFVSTQVRWTCGDLDGEGFSSPQDCTASGGHVTAELTYPDCFDGHTQLREGWFPAGIDPEHFTYSPCPPNWQRIAQLVTRQHFINPATNQEMVTPFNADGKLGLSFASGAHGTYHGDFLNSWSRGLSFYVQQCVNGLAPGPDDVRVKCTLNGT